MEPNINSANIYLIRTNAGLFIKSIKVNNNKIVLKSQNENYNDIELNFDEVNIIGRVSGVLIKV